MTFLMIYGAFAFLKASVPFHYDGMVKIFKHSPLVICKRKVPKYRNFWMKDSYNLLVHALRNMTCSLVSITLFIALCWKTSRLAWCCKHVQVLCCDISLSISFLGAQFQVSSSTIVRRKPPLAALTHIPLCSSFCKSSIRRQSLSSAHQIIGHRECEY